MFEDKTTEELNAIERALVIAIDAHRDLLNNRKETMKELVAEFEQSEPVQAIQVGIDTNAEKIAGFEKELRALNLEFYNRTGMKTFLGGGVRVTKAKEKMVIEDNDAAVKWAMKKEYPSYLQPNTKKFADISPDLYDDLGIDFIEFETIPEKVTPTIKGDLSKVVAKLAEEQTE